jgi:hypothetical protein
MGQNIMVITTQVLTVIAFLATVAQMIWQLTSAKKPPTPDNSAAEARKGYEMVVDGKPDSLPVVYGRAKVGGIRVFNDTSSEFHMAGPNSNKTWASGSGADYELYSQNVQAKEMTPEGTVDLTKVVRDRDGVPLKNADGSYQYIVVDYIYSNASVNNLNQLDVSHIKGHRNQFLFFQQALCVGEIYDIVDVIIDDSRYIDDPALGTYGSVPASNFYTADEDPSKTRWDDKDAPRSAFRIDMHYKIAPNNRGFNCADETIAKNFPNRAKATFTGLTYISAVFRLDRDDPQFTSVPTLQFLVKGKLIHYLTPTYQLSTDKVYSNNPALCLLDYLLSADYGAGVDFDTEVDAQSFYKAATVCSTIVQKNVAVGGKIWKPTDRSSSATSRDLALYECNMMIDTKKSVRDNIEAILATMADARLIWAGGKYKLSLQYPNFRDATTNTFTSAVGGNEWIQVATTITDNDLVLDQDVEVTWPSASERLNHCIVKFHNEAEDFKEDSVSWPSKFGYDILRGVGGFKYPEADFSWNEDHAYGRFLNNYAVWSGDTSPTTLEYIIIIKKEDIIADSSANFTLEMAVDSEMDITIKNSDGTIKHSYTCTKAETGKNTKKIESLSFGSPVEDKWYKVIINARNVDGYKPKDYNDKGVAVKLYKSNRVFWTTRDFAYSSVYRDVATNNKYLEYKAEDNQLDLELEIFADGITDRYHASARAEELVKTSRSSYTIKFKYVLRDIYLEPGDFIKIESETLNLLTSGNTSTYFRVNNVKIGEESTCEIVAQHFNYDQLAWTEKNDEVTTPKTPNFVSKSGPSWVYFDFAKKSLESSSGTLTWAEVTAASVKYYMIYMYDLNGETVSSVTLANTNSIPVFNVIGQSTTTSFTLPKISATNVIFAVRAVFSNGSFSDWAYTSQTQAILLVRRIYNFPNLIVTGALPNTLSWTACSLNIDGKFLKEIPAGSIAATQFPLYLYLDTSSTSNIIKTTNTRSDLLNNKLIATYNGGIDVVLSTVSVLPPENLKINNVVGTYFEGEDAEISWECSAETLKDPSGLKEYLVRILKMDGTVVHSVVKPPLTTTTRGNSFKINAELNKKIFESFTRKFKIEIYAVDVEGIHTDSALEATIENKAPSKFTLETEGSYKSVYLKAIDSSSDRDIIEYIFKQYASETATNPIATKAVKSNYLYYSVLPDQKYWYTVTGRDIFGIGEESERRLEIAGGTIAYAISLTSDKKYIIYKADGTKVTANDNIVFTARVSDATISDFSFKFYVDNVLQVGNVVGNLLTYSPPATYVGNPVNVRVELYTVDNQLDMISTDFVMVYQLKLGATNTQCVLENPYQMLPVNIDGTVQMSNSGTSLDVFYGAEQLTYSATDVSSAGISNSRYSVTAVATNIKLGTPVINVLPNLKTCYTKDYTGMALDYMTATVIFTVKIKDPGGVVTTQTVTQTLYKDFASDESADIIKAARTAASLLTSDASAIPSPVFAGTAITYSTAKTMGKSNGTIHWTYPGDVTKINGFVIAYFSSTATSQATPTYKQLHEFTNVFTVGPSVNSFTIPDLGTDEYTCAFIYAFRYITLSVFNTLEQDVTCYLNKTMYQAVSPIARSHANEALSKSTDRYAINVDLKYGDKVILASKLTSIGDDYDKGNNAVDTALTTPVTDMLLSYSNLQPSGNVDILLQFAYSGALADIDGFAIYEATSATDVAISDMTASKVFLDSNAVYITKEDLDETPAAFYYKFIDARPTMFRTHFIVPYRTVGLKATQDSFKVKMKTALNTTDSIAANYVTSATKDGNKIWVCLGAVARSRANGSLYQPMTYAEFDGYVQTADGLVSIKQKIVDFNNGNKGSVADITTVIPLTSNENLTLAGNISNKTDATASWSYLSADETKIDGFIVSLWKTKINTDGAGATPLPNMDKQLAGTFVSLLQTERSFTFTDLDPAYYYNVVVIPYRILSDTIYNAQAKTDKSGSPSGGYWKAGYPFKYSGYRRCSSTNLKYTRSDTASIAAPQNPKKGDYWLNIDNTLNALPQNGAYPFRQAMYDGTSWYTLTEAEIIAKESAGFKRKEYASATEPRNEIGFIWRNTSSSVVSGVAGGESVAWDAASSLWVPLSGGRVISMTLGAWAGGAQNISVSPLEGNFFFEDTGPTLRRLYIARDGKWQELHDLAKTSNSATTEYGTTIPTTSSHPTLKKYLYYALPKTGSVSTVFKFYTRKTTSDPWVTEATNLTSKRLIESSTIPNKV